MDRMFVRILSCTFTVGTDSVQKVGYLWGALSLSDYVVEVVRDVCVQTTGQVPRFADPVVIQSSEIIIDK